jgi:hypothetical protein
MAGRNMPLVDILLTAAARRAIAKRERSISEIGKGGRNQCIEQYFLPIMMYVLYNMGIIQNGI